MNFPIVYIHFGVAPDYLIYSLIQSRTFNPDQTIYLVSNHRLPKEITFVKEIDLQEVWQSAGAFGQIYKHFSINTFAFELFCIQRWFILRDLFARESLERCIYLDSDVLLFCKAIETLRDFPGADFTMSLIGPHATCFFNVQVIHSLCDLITDFYLDKPRPCFQKIHDKMKEVSRPTAKYNLCDMVFFDTLMQEGQLKCAESSNILGDITYDHNINTAHPGFVMADGIKKIEWIQGLPYGRLESTGQLVRFKCLHYQGQAKRFMARDFDISARSILGEMPAAKA